MSETPNFTNISEARSQPLNSRATVRAAVSKISERSTTAGAPFISLDVVDKTGSLPSMIWSPLVTGTPEHKGVYIFRGTIKEYKESPQFNITAFEKVESFEPTEFMESYPTKEAVTHIIETVNGFKNPLWSCLFAAIFNLNHYSVFGDKSRWNDFMMAPAAKSRHQNRLGGLCVHTSGVLRNVQNSINPYIAPPANILNYIDHERLQMGAILHDIAKTKEYTWDLTIEYAEHFIPHHIEVLSWIDQAYLRVKEIGPKPIPKDEIDIHILKRLVLSHHGAHGPVELKTLEERLLHAADLLDAQVFDAAEGRDW